MMRTEFVECYHLSVIEEGKDIVRAKYEAPSPMFGDSPRKTAYLFVPEDEHFAPLWSFAPYPWLDSSEVESTSCERYMFDRFAALELRANMPAL